MDDKLERLKEKLLVCVVCMDEYKDPRILPCHHSLCYECIANLFKHSSGPREYFLCPYCRKDIAIPGGSIESLPTNIYIVNLQDELRSGEYDYVCDMCKEKGMTSEFHCIECDKGICRFCIHSHRLEFHDNQANVKRIQRHFVPTQSPFFRLCTSHVEEKLQFFCLTCNLPVCIICSCNSHTLHHLISLSEKLFDLYFDLKSEMVMIESDMKNLIDAKVFMSALEQEVSVSSSKSFLALDRAANEACQAIMETKSAIEKELLRSEKRQKTAIKVFKRKIQKPLISLHNGYCYLADLQESDMSLEAFQTFKQFSSKLQKLRKDYASQELNLQDNLFLSPDYKKTYKIPLEYLRDLFSFGKLGGFTSSHQQIVIDSKTLLTKKKSSRLPRKLASCFTLSRLLLFCFAFSFFLFVSWILEKREIMPLTVVFHERYNAFTEYLPELLYNVKDLVEVFHERHNAYSKYLQELFYVEDSDDVLDQ